MLQDQPTGHRQVIARACSHGKPAWQLDKAISEVHDALSRTWVCLGDKQRFAHGKWLRVQTASCDTNHALCCRNIATGPMGTRKPDATAALGQLSDQNITEYENRTSEPCSDDCTSYHPILTFRYASYRPKYLQRTFLRLYFLRPQRKCCSRLFWKVPSIHIFLGTIRTFCFCTCDA